MPAPRPVPPSFALALLSLCISLAAQPALCIDNGLGLTPQMGWNSWNLFACRVNETIVKDAAHAMISSGMAKAGYEYVNIDDCWQGHERLADGSITWDPVTFPSGIPALAKYIHGLGLKFGIYSARCPRSCQNRPASYGHYVQDAKTFASWEIDYLKFDNCHGCPLWSDPVTQFAEMGAALNATGRKIFYSNELINNGEWVRQGFQMCNSARIGHDIKPFWDFMISEVDIDTPLAPWAGPGFYNDADMLEVGNGMGYTEDKTHMAFWCMLAAPLLSGNNLATMSAPTRDILTNPGFLALNQDKLGLQATLCGEESIFEKKWQVWTKPLYNGSTAVMIVNRGEKDPTNLKITADFAKCLNMGDSIKEVPLYDVWSGDYLGNHNDSFTVNGLPLHDSMVVRLEPARPASRICAESRMMDVPVRLWCPKGTSKITVDEAFWGTPEGTCGNYRRGKCNLSRSLEVVKDLCNGRESCSVFTSNKLFHPDHCIGEDKFLKVQWHCT